MKIIVISGPRWAGVQSVVARLEEAFLVNGLRRVIFHTSREPIAGEKNGKDFHFVRRRDFAAMARRGDFVWFKGRLGVSRRELENASCCVFGIAPKDVQHLCDALAQKDTEISRIFVSAGNGNGVLPNFNHVIHNKRGPEAGAARAILLAEQFLKLEATFFQT